MYNKENICTPKKQGILYTISTGKNNGVYLPKDISYQNHRSLKLLTKQSQQSHKSYVQTLKQIQKQKLSQAKESNNIIQVESFNQNYGFNMKCISSLKNTLNESGILSKNLKVQLQKLKDGIQQQNAVLQQSALPALKKLKQKIKLNKEQQMANYSKMRRELQKIEQCFNVISNGAKESQRKLQVSEQHYKGCSHFQ